MGRLDSLKKISSVSFFTSPKKSGQRTESIFHPSSNNSFIDNGKLVVVRSDIHQGKLIDFHVSFFEKKRGHPLNILPQL